MLVEQPLGISDDMIAVYQQAIKMHLETFATLNQSNLEDVAQQNRVDSQQEDESGQNSNWPPTPDQIQEFFERSAGIRVA